MLKTEAIQPAGSGRHSLTVSSVLVLVQGSTYDNGAGTGPGTGSREAC